MKQLFLSLLALCLSFTASAAYQWTDAKGTVWTFTTSGNTASIHNNGNKAISGTIPAVLKIPSTLYIGNSSYTVTSIGEYAFYKCTGLTSVTIPESVTSIGGEAFKECTGLTSITIPESVTSIETGVFYRCTGLTSVIIPESVTSIGEDAFWGCSNLTSITIPSSVTSIGENAFDNCTGLTSITIPSSVTSIGDGAFYLCTRLTSITLPENLRSIKPILFRFCSGLTNVTIPSSVTSIGYSAFQDCTGLTSITIPESVTSIGEYAFNGCYRLTFVTVDNPTPVSIDEETFSNSSNATLYVPTGSKGAYKAADYWNKFKEIVEMGVTLNKSSITLNKIGATETLSATIQPPTASQTVTWTSSNTNVATVSSNGVVTAKGSGTATITATTTDGTNLKATCSVTVNVSKSITLNKSSVTFKEIGATETLKATIQPSTAQQTVTWTSSNTNVATVSSGGVVTAKGNGTATITATTTDGTNLKATCSVTVSLIGKSITLNKSSVSLNKVGATETLKATIQPSTALQTVTWTSSNTNVATVSSNGVVTAMGEGSTTISATLVSNPDIKATCSVVVSTKPYIYVGGIYYLPNIENETADVTNMVLGFYPGEEERTEYAGTINIPETITWNGVTFTVTGIHDWAFLGMRDLQSVVIPSTVTSIGFRSFAKSEKLARVIFMNADKSNLTIISDSAFQKCTSLNNVVLPNSLINMGKYAFADCSSLSKIQLSSSLSYIDKFTFTNCTSLNNVVLPNSLINIGKYAFANCSSLSKIQWSSSLSFIDEFAFTNCTALTSIVFPESLSAIQNYAFANDNKLKEITFPSRLQGIGAGCFFNCSALQTTTFKIATPTMTVGSDAFDGCNSLNRVNIDRLDCWVQTNFNTEKSNPTSLAHHLYFGGTEIMQAVVPEGTIYINNYAFSGCSNIREVVLPQSIQYVNDNIFYKCSALNAVYCYATMVPAFLGTDDPAKMNDVFNRATLYVPKDAISDYADDSWWKRFKKIEECAWFEPADVNHDGVIDSADIVAVIKEMPDGDTKADVNADNVIDSADIVAVIKAMK